MGCDPPQYRQSRFRRAGRASETQLRRNPDVMCPRVVSLAGRPARSQDSQVEMPSCSGYVRPSQVSVVPSGGPARCRLLALFANSLRCNGASAAEGRPSVAGTRA